MSSNKHFDATQISISQYLASLLDFTGLKLEIAGDWIKKNEVDYRKRLSH